ncbi:hypothetical protein SAMN05421640_1280 [Ekhidna lutea]|uniref:DUF3575 domain-containing protein n=1 Tax=Ekhidna lutea TaxID=447679 RepID=A0A239HF03_EKHLU|nr:DUF6048 family protein [Ekhidna lutea]SNS79957.1 hypothetical protein SAMN05421640_1280 [Ekhidna lutea]
MVKQRLLFIFSLVLLTGACLAQEAEVDSIDYKRAITPSLYLDYGKLFTIPSTLETKYEGGLELLINEKFPLILELGQATLTPEGAYSNGTYESEGIYFRLGAGYVSQFKPKNKIGISTRYAASKFSENGRIFIESPSGSQESYIQNINRKDLKANWYEVVVYSDRTLSDLFTIGLNLRLRVLANYDEQEAVDVYSIPGYGRSFDKTIPAANLFLKISF